MPGLKTRPDKRLITAVPRNHFAQARARAAAKYPAMAAEIKAFYFHELRAKAADDTSDECGEQAASDLLGSRQREDNTTTLLRRARLSVLQNRLLKSTAIFWKRRNP